jgi:hypothetical protein
MAVQIKSFWKITFQHLGIPHQLCCKHKELNGFSFVVLKGFFENPELPKSELGPNPDLSYIKFKSRKSIEIPLNQIYLIEELNPEVFIHLKIVKQ